MSYYQLYYFLEGFIFHVFFSKGDQRKHFENKFNKMEAQMFYGQFIVHSV